MSPVYVPPAVITDPATIRGNAIALMEAELPGWKPIPGSPEMVLIDAFSFTAGEQAEVLVQRLTSVYRGLGQLVSTPPIEAQPATSLATVTMVNNAGYTIPAGSLIVGIRNANNELEGFKLTADLVVGAGSTTGTATLIAEEPGTGANSLTGAAELIAAPPSVLSVSLATSGGGLEAESEEEYLARLTEALSIMKPGVVLANDAAILARSIPGVWRAVGVDRFKPAAADGGEGAEATNEEKCLTVTPTDVNGVASDAGHLASIKAAIEAKREPGFKVFVVAPHYQEVDVTIVCSAWPEENLANVKAAVEAAIKNALSPATFASDATGNPRHWVNDPVIHIASLYQAVGLTPGVRWCSEAKVGKHSEAQASADLTMFPTSKLPVLPKLVTLSVTVNASS